MSKRYFVKFYDNLGTYLTTIEKVSFANFNKKVNGGLSDLTFTIPRKFDDFDEDYLVKFNNRVELWVSDEDTGSDSRLVYSGYIPSYNPKIQNDTENVTITAYGYVTQLATKILRNSDYYELITDTSTTLTYGNVPATDAEVGAVITKMIDRYRAEYSDAVVNYAAGTIGNTGVNFSARFRLQSVFDAISTAVSHTPQDWYWYVGEDNVLKLAVKDATPKHTFVFNKHFQAIDVQKNIEQMYNKVVFSNGNTQPSILKVYKNEASIALYGEVMTSVVDEQVFTFSTADKKMAKFLAENSMPRIRTQVTIFDNNESAIAGYDIESIQPGDTCQFIGFNDITSKTFSNDMVVVSVNYTPDSVDLELEQLQPSLARALVATEDNVNASPPDVNQLIKAITTDDDFYLASLQNSWVPYDPVNNFETPGFYRDGDGIVHLQGIMSSGTHGASDVLLFTLPVGFRPPIGFIQPVLIYPGTATAVIDIRPDGTVTLEASSAASNQWLSLDGCCFPADGVDSGMAVVPLVNSWNNVNTALWSPMMYVLSPTHGKARFWGRIQGGSSITATMTVLPTTLQPSQAVFWTILANNALKIALLDRGDTALYQNATASTTNVNFAGIGYFPQRPFQFQRVTFQNSWADFAGGYESVAYWKDPFGIVHLQGLARGGTSAATMFTLPVGYRPRKQHGMLAVANDTTADIFIGTDGQVQCASGQTTYVNLSGLEFLAAP